MLNPAYQQPFAALHAPVALYTRALTVVLPGNLEKTPRRRIVFPKKMVLVGMAADVVQNTVTNPALLVPGLNDLFVSLDLDQSEMFTAQTDDAQVLGIETPYVSLGAMISNNNPGRLLMIPPNNPSPEFGFTFRWKRWNPATTPGAPLFEDALISLAIFYNYV